MLTPQGLTTGPLSLRLIKAIRCLVQRITRLEQTDDKSRKRKLSSGSAEGEGGQERQRLATTTKAPRATANSAAYHLTPLESAISVIARLRREFGEVAQDDVDAEQGEQWVFQVFGSRDQLGPAGSQKRPQWRPLRQ